MSVSLLFCFNFVVDALRILQLLISFSFVDNVQGFNIYDFLECVVDSYIVVLRYLVELKSVSFSVMSWLAVD